MTAVLEFNNVSLNREGKVLLENIDWNVSQDQRWVVLGPNGAGKTTLLRIAAAQIQPTNGSVTLLGSVLGKVNVFELRTRIGFASSALANHIPNSETVLDAVMTASYGITGRWKEAYDLVDERRARRVLAEWDLSSFSDRKFGTLSDGERKRAQIARAVMPDPELLLLDEPVASLDMGAREHTIQVLSNYASSPSSPAIIMVTHHIEEIPKGFTHALILAEGEVFAAGEIASTITSEKISEAFGYSLEVYSEGGRMRVRGAH